MKYFVLGLMILLMAACQKDDICPATTETTPLLIIRFYDFEEPTDLKEVVGLNLIAEGRTDSLFVSEQTTDSIAIPLKTFQNYTNYQFIKYLNEDPDNDIPPNSDIVEFSYFPREEYVSKACGFKVEYLDFNALEVAEGLNENWIKDILVEQTTIDDETRAHLIIYH